MNLILPSIIIKNVQSISNKMVELGMLTQHQKEHKESSIMLFRDMANRAVTKSKCHMVGILPSVGGRDQEERD